VLIDAHVHLNHYHDSVHGEGGPENLRHRTDALFSKMAERSVDHAVVITSYKVSPERPGVEEVLETLADDPRTTLVEGLRWRGEQRTDLFGLEERIRDGLVKGIKLYPGYEPYPINDPSLESVYRLAGKHKVPVLIHTGDTYSKTAKVRMAHPLLVDDVAVDFPDVTFVMCHAGNPWFHDAAEVVYKNDNVYADISGLTLGDVSTDFEAYVIRRLIEMIQYLGAAERQLMYGTDWPLVRMRPYLDFLERLPIDDEAKEHLRWKTAAEVFSIPRQRLEAARKLRLEAAAKGEAGPAAESGPGSGP
jgi:uncharacterized protein